MIYAESRASQKQMQVFHSFLQAAPHTQAVEKHGSVVIDLLKGLRADFEKSQVDSTKEETEAKNNYNLAKQAQDYAISEAESSKAEKQTILGDRKSDLAGYNADLTEEEELRDTQTGDLKTHEAGCKTKAEEWETRSKIR